MKYKGKSTNQKSPPTRKNYIAPQIINSDKFANGYKRYKLAKYFSC